MKRIAVIGATGLLGAPVAQELINAGFIVTILARDEARKKFGTSVTYVVGDLDDESTLIRLLTDQDGLYLNLSVKPDSSNQDTIRWAGESKQLMHFVSASDHGKQVANSFTLDTTENREYIIQGPEAYTMDEGAKIFIDNYPKQKMAYSHAPLPLLQLGGVLSHSMEYVAKLSESMNNYPEQFRAQPTWYELGKPTTTLTEYARQAD